MARGAALAQQAVHGLDGFGRHRATHLRYLGRLKSRVSSVSRRSKTGKLARENPNEMTKGIRRGATYKPSLRRVETTAFAVLLRARSQIADLLFSRWWGILMFEIGAALAAKPNCPSFACLKSRVEASLVSPASRDFFSSTKLQFCILLLSSSFSPPRF